MVVFIELLLEAQHKHATDSIILDLETWGNLIAQTFRNVVTQEIANLQKYLSDFENTQRSRSNSDFYCQMHSELSPKLKLK